MQDKEVSKTALVFAQVVIGMLAFCAIVVAVAFLFKLVRWIIGF